MSCGAANKARLEERPRRAAQPDTGAWLANASWSATWSGPGLRFARFSILILGEREASRLQTGSGLRFVRFSISQVIQLPDPPRV